MNALLKKSLAEFVGVTVFLTAITASASGFKPLSLAIALGLMILLTGAVSGGHLNPAVTLFFFARKEITLGTLLAYVAAQIAGAIAGANLGVLFTGSKLVGITASAINVAPAAFTGEVVATAGLVWIIGTLIQNKQTQLIPVAVAAWVFSAANFTPTGAQANPAVTVGLMLQGIAANQASMLVIAQLVGLVVAILLLIVFSPKAKKANKKK